ncbi:MAG: cytochrome c [Trueperaceae bacterium]
MQIFKSVFLLLAASMLTLGSLSFAQDEVPEGFDPELWTEGRRVFNEIGGMGCAGCHGTFGANELGGHPVIRGDDIDVDRIHGAVEGMQAMVFLQALISDDEIEAVAHYISYLGTMEPLVVTQRREAFEIPEGDPVLPADTHVQLILYNQDRAACTWTVDGIDTEPVVIGGRQIDALDWVTAETGTVEAYCAERPDDRLSLTLQ